MVRILIILFFFASGFAWAQMPLATKSKKAIELYTEADNFRVRGQFSQAIGLLNEAIRKDNEFVEAYYRLGIIYMTIKDFPQAIRNLEKGLSLTDDVRKQKIFWYDLGESYFTTGEYDKAEEILSQYLKAEIQNKPKIERARLLMSNIKFARDNRDNASAYKLKPLRDE